MTSTSSSSTRSAGGRRRTLLAILAVRVSSRAGLPSLLIYLLMGVALGETGAGHPVRGRRARPRARLRGTGRDPRRGRSHHELAGGAPGDAASASRWPRSVSRHRSAWWPSGALPARPAAGSWRVLLGAVTSPTDAAAVFSVLRASRSRRRCRAPWRRSPGSTTPRRSSWSRWSPPARCTSSGVARHGRHRRPRARRRRALGLAIGFGGGWVMRRAALPASGLYPIAALGLASSRTPRPPRLHASGFAAVYVAALILGNSELPHRAATRSFAEGIAWLAQIGLFVMLGLLLPPGPDHLESRAGRRRRAGPDRRRPSAVGAGQRAASSRCRWRRAGCSCPGRGCAGPSHRPRHDPAGRGRRRRRALFDLVFVMVVIYTLVTAPTLPWVARRLGLARPSRAPRPRRRGRPAGADRRRPAPGHDHRAVADARGRGRRAAAAAGASVVAGHPRGRGRSPSPGRRCGAATTCSWSPRAGCARRPRRGCARSRPAGPPRPWLGPDGGRRTARAGRDAQHLVGPGGLQMNPACLVPVHLRPRVKPSNPDRPPRPQPTPRVGPEGR